MRHDPDHQEARLAHASTTCADFLNALCFSDALKKIYEGSKWAKLKYYLPFMEWLPNYRLSL